MTTKKEDKQNKIGGEWKISPDFYQSGIFPEADPDPEEPKQLPKAEAPKADPEGDQVKIKDLYRRETYWILPEDAQFIKDYAYTERVSVRTALGMIIEKASAKILYDYNEEGKQLEHYNERKK